MTVAAGGAFINYKLIALPMSEMVGAGDYMTATLRTSEVAALVIIFVEASMGLFLVFKGAANFRLNFIEFNGKRKLATAGGR